MHASLGHTGVIVRIVTVAYVIALSIWAGGLVVLGAIVAPAVFGIVPAPASADAMTIVFRRFDVVAIGCAVVALACEAALAWRGGRATRIDLARAAGAVVAAALAIVEGTYLSPAIEALHRGGAVRGFGDAGLALERLHRQAEAAAKAELVLLLVVIALVVLRADRPSTRSADVVSTEPK